MCGIVGMVSRQPLGSGDFAAVRAANHAISHRGPDGSGEFMQGQGKSGGQSHLFMAMRRLSIIDLAGGWQPLHNEDSSLSLIANGEIYNFVELRETLKAKGHQFRSGSDCESIVHLYEELGLACVHRLRGMFAFALWDETRRRLVLGRDRLGEKPLYLRIESDRIAFASEMKGLLAMGDTAFELDPIAIHSYMHYGWIPEPNSLIRGIRKLPAGHLMVIDVDTWQVHEYPYWSLANAAPISGNPAELIRAELDTIGSMITRSEVPVGVALSGGVDSSLIAALAARHSSTPPHAFSIGYSGRPRQDERSMARELAARLDMPFHEMEIDVDDMVAAFPLLNVLRDDPISDVAGYGYFVLSQQARAHGCPVLLQGHGGDELFWGYEWSVRAVQHSERKAHGAAIHPLAAFGAALPRGANLPHFTKLAYLLGGLVAGWRRLSPGLASPADRLVVYDLTDTFQMAAHGLMSTYTVEFGQRVGDYDVGRFFDRGSNSISCDIQVLNLLCEGYLRENGLAQGDRLSMANSVELRLPLVDYRLAELAVGLQKTTPAYALSPKQWLRDAAKDLLPTEIFSRPKRGFNPPVALWLSALRQQYADELRNGYLVTTGILDARAAERLCGNAWRLGYANDLFIKYLSLEFWCRGMSKLATAAAADKQAASSASHTVTAASSNSANTTQLRLDATSTVRATHGH